MTSPPRLHIVVSAGRGSPNVILFEGVFGYLSFSFNEIGPAIEDSLKEEVPFNLWDSKFKEMKMDTRSGQELINQL